jgi:predicted nucleic acid-binding protein
MMAVTARISKSGQVTIPAETREKLGLKPGDTHATLSEVVMHEVFYTMMSSRLRQLSLDDLCELMRSILAWPGWVFAAKEKTIYLRALEILQGHPKLEFSDSVIAARAESLDATLATFDLRLATAYPGAVWE